MTKYIYPVIEPKCSLMARRVTTRHPLLKLLRDQIKLVVRTVELPAKVYKTCVQPLAIPAWVRPCGTKWQSAGLKRLAGHIGSVSRGRRRKVRLSGRTLGLLLLLHFWPVVSLPYVPNTFKVENKQLKYKYKGIATAVPEVADLEAFLTSSLVSWMTLARTRHWLAIDRGIWSSTVPSKPGSTCSAVFVHSPLERLPPQKSAIVSLGSRFGGLRSRRRPFAFIWFDESTVDPNWRASTTSSKRCIENRLFRAIAMTAIVQGHDDQRRGRAIIGLFPTRSCSATGLVVDVGRYIDGLKRRNKELREMQITIQEIDRLSEVVHRLVNQYLRQRVKARRVTIPYDRSSGDS